MAAASAPTSSASVEALLKSASLHSAIDVPTLLSSEYDSDGPEGALETSLEASTGGFLESSMEVDTPVRVAVVGGAMRSQLVPAVADTLFA